MTLATVRISFAVVLSTAGGGCGRVGFDPGASDAAAIDAAAADAAIPDPTLLVWLPFDDGIADRIASDASGHGHDATCSASATCPAEVPGRTGLALSGFSLNAPGIEIPDTPTWRFSTSFTLSAWVRVSQLGSGDAIISKPLGGPTQNSYQLEIIPTGELTCHANPGGGLTRVITTTTFPTNTWTHVACTYDGTLRRYIGGVLVAGPSAPVVPGYDARSLYFGCDRNGDMPAGAFDGELDDVRIHAIALSDAQVAALAQ